MVVVTRSRHNGKRIEVKSGRMMRVKKQLYSVMFQKIRPNKYDQLLFVFFAPDGLRIFEFTGELQTNGIYMQRRFCATATSDAGALEKLVASMACQAELLGFIKWNDLSTSNSE